MDFRCHISDGTRHTDRRLSPVEFQINLKPEIRGLAHKTRELRFRNPPGRA